MRESRGIRLLADDMTGALDAAAEFAAAFGTLTVGPADRRADALDVATRELSPDGAAERMAELAGRLAPEPGRISFLKIDSLLRGHAGREIDAVLSRVAFDRVVIAPAMPWQGRIMRNGRQHVRTGSVWAATGEDIAETLRGLGREVTLSQPGDAVSAPLVLADAESDDELETIARNGLAGSGSTLFVGTAGLAGALAAVIGGSMTDLPSLQGPVLGLIGSHHPVMRAQLAAVPAITCTIDERSEGKDIARRLASDGAAFTIPEIPDGLGAHAAAERIAATFAALVQRLAPPGLLLVSGGETLRGLLAPLGAQSLVVHGALEPGMPISRLVGGRWDGVTVLSKSGAFGAPDFLARLVSTVGPARKALSR